MTRESKKPLCGDRGLGAWAFLAAWLAFLGVVKNVDALKWLGEAFG